MTFPIPKNTFGINHAKFPLSDTFLDFQRLIIAAHIGEAKESNKIVTVEVPLSDPETFHKNSDTIENFFEWLTDRQIKFNFVKTAKTPKQQQFGNVFFNYVSLFSGGLDSASYQIMPSIRNKLGLLHHTHTSNRMLGVARNVYQRCMPSNHKLVVTELNLASTVDIPLLHVRGAIFLTNLLCVAGEYNIKKVVIPENGPLMINYPVSMLVAPTRTADPAMIAQWSEIFNKITNSKIKVETPFIRKTKTEIILESQEPKLIKYTWSCSTSQGISKMCGLCMACFVRILSLYAIDQGEVITKFYERSPFTVCNNELKNDRLSSFRILCNCLEFWKNLIDPDLAVTGIEREDYSNLVTRHPVFENFALDMYVGLKKFLEEHTNFKILGSLGKEYLNKLDNRVIEKRQKQLEVLCKKHGWNH